MRIISDFRDYYDSALSHGIDPDLFYIRKEKVYDIYPSRDIEKQLPNNIDDLIKPVFVLLGKIANEIRVPGTKHNWNRNITINPTVIGFCGNLYPGMNIDTITYYSVESIVSSLPDKILKESNISRKKFENIFSKNKKRKENRWSRDLVDCDWNKILSEYETKNFDNIFIGLKCPIFKLVSYKYNHVQFVLNPRLNEESFQKIKHPVDCFQEISMYLGNQLAIQEDPKTTIPDNIMRDEKGFDKWSFKKLPTKKQ